MTDTTDFLKYWGGVFIAGTAAIIGYRYLTDKGTATPTETKEAREFGCSSCPEKKDETFESEYSLEYINPEPVAGSSDVHGAEGFVRNAPSTAHGRGFASDTVATAQMASVYGGCQPIIGTGTTLLSRMPRFTKAPIVSSATPITTFARNVRDPGGKGASIPVRVPLPLNPNDYQTLSGLIHERPISPDSPPSSGSGGGYVGDEMSLAGTPWDNANDWMPEYRFPWPWSPAYSPTAPSRGFDHRSIRTY